MQICILQLEVCVFSISLKELFISCVQLKKVRSLLLAGATEHEGFIQQLRLLEGAFKMSAKDLRSQVVREACITLGYKETLLYLFVENEV